jgi:RNA polymerase sigma-70 factor (ECF subfamily)
MDEKQIICEAKKGDRQALNTLLTDNYSILKGYVLKITGDASLAQDITQETMLKAVLNIKKYEARAKFSTFLITIATNLYRDHLRKNKRLQSMDETFDLPGGNMEEEAIESMEYRQVVSILTALPYEKKAVFVLKHYYGYKYEEIAKILDCPIGTVRSRLHNTIETIKKEMERRKLI